MEGRHARPPFVHINTLLVQAVPEIPEFLDLIGLDERVVAALGYYLWGGAGQRDGRDAQLPGRRAAEPAQDAGTSARRGGGGRHRCRVGGLFPDEGVPRGELDRSRPRRTALSWQWRVLALTAAGLFCR